MAKQTVLLVGTRKGLWIGLSDEAREDWTVDRPALRHGGGLLLHGRHPRRDDRGCCAGASSSWLGPQVRRSDDLGETWQETPDGGVRFPEGTGRQRRADLAARARRRGRTIVYAGTEPGAVWRSDRPRRDVRARAGALGPPAPHRSGAPASAARRSTRSCRTRPTPTRSPSRISTGGVYQTDRRRRAPGRRATTGIRAEFLPEGQQYPEFGQCVHKVTRHPARPERLFLQNHGGVYRSDDEGGSWTSIADGLPADFGFPIVVHPHEPDTVFVFPINGGERRYPPEGKARVWRSTRRRRDLGGARRAGCPTPSSSAVMRDAMCADDHDPRRALLRRPQRRRLGVAATRARPGARSSPTCPT